MRALIIAPQWSGDAVMSAPLLARIPRRVGYRGEGRRLLLNQRTPNLGGRPSMVAFYGALAGTPAPPNERPRLQFAEEALDAAMRSAGVQRNASAR